MLEADLTKEDDCRKMAEAAVDRYGRLDILVNNVGIGSVGNVLELDVEGWHRTFDANLLGQVLTSRYAIPRMIESGGGSIINIASFLGMRVGGSGSVAYNVSKGGVMTLTIKMAVDHGRDNIRVNCIAPGQLYNPRMVEKMSDERRELRRLSRAPGYGGHAVGYRLGGPLPGQRRSPLDHRCHTTRGRGAGGHDTPRDA